MAMDLQESAKKWIEALGCDHKDVEDSQTKWHLEVAYPVGRPDNHLMHVAGLPGPAASLIVASRIRISEQHQKAVEALPADERRAFMYGLRDALNRGHVDFEFHPPAPGAACPAGFQVSMRRFADGLNYDEFARTIGSVYKAELSGIWFIQEALEQDSLPAPSVVFDFERSNMPEA